MSKEVFGRFSVSKDDPGHEAFIQQGHHNAAWSVLLDGKEIPKVVTADTSAGEILVNEVNDQGRVFIRDGILAQKTLHGNVQVFIGI